MIFLVLVGVLVAGAPQLDMGEAPIADELVQLAMTQHVG